MRQLLIIVATIALFKASYAAFIVSDITDTTIDFCANGGLVSPDECQQTADALGVQMSLDLSTAEQATGEGFCKPIFSSKPRFDVLRFFDVINFQCPSVFLVCRFYRPIVESTLRKLSFVTKETRNLCQFATMIRFSPISRHIIYFNAGQEVLCSQRCLATME